MHKKLESDPAPLSIKSPGSASLRSAYGLDHSGSSLLSQGPGLDTTGTSGILGQEEGRKDRPDEQGRRWQSEHLARKRVRNQVNELLTGINTKEKYAETFRLSKATAVMNQCGKQYVVEKIGPANYKYVHSYHCKKKYCPRCAILKRDRLLGKFSDFFKDERGADLLNEYDLAVLTVTLRHGPGSRQGWYFDELKTHWRNIIKYGPFKRYIAGGIYTTEITYKARTGFHIHRHAIVLIPKAEAFRCGIVGRWKKEGRWKFKWTDCRLRQELRNAWHKKTGDSWEVDITPFNPDRDQAANFLEVFKYVAKPSKQSRAVPWQIVEQMECNTRQKFMNRFGLLYKEKGLSLNIKKEKPDNDLNLDRLYYARGLYRTRAGRWAFSRIVKFVGPKEDPMPFQDFNRICAHDKERIILQLHDRQFRRCYKSLYDPKSSLSGQLRAGNEVFSATGARGDPGISSGLPPGIDQDRKRTLEGVQTEIDFSEGSEGNRAIPKLSNAYSQ